MDDFTWTTDDFSFFEQIQIIKAPLKSAKIRCICVNPCAIKK
jgi:hypothetical protein